MAKPNLPQGTRDFNAETVRKRNYIFDTIRAVFELYGFQPLETPAMENLDTLMGKYGDEGDKLIFKILNNGLDNPSKKEKIKEDFEKIFEGKNSTTITERALRYDLTIPFARYVAMNFGQLTFPFKRYQIQPVWRADRPQRGRYREFYQCDADVVGSNSLLNEVELANIYATVFEKLGVDVEIKINSRKLLTALAETCGGADKMMDITIAIDKLDKIGIEKVKEELRGKNLDEDQIAVIEKYLWIAEFSGNNDSTILELEKIFDQNINATEGLKELKFILEYFEVTQTNFLLKNKLSIDPTLARGLNYYTGCIFEVKALKVEMGSIGGGGRYDDLTGLFGVPNVPGVGISFGVDRIYDVMEMHQPKLFPEQLQTGTQILFFNLGEKESKAAFNLMQTLRSNNIKCELFHEQSKFDKQFKYAEKKSIPFIAILGSTELQENTITIKNLKTGEQKTVLQSELKSFEPLRREGTKEHKG